MKTAELKVLPVTVLKPAEYNPRKKLKPGDKEYEKIKASIEEFGFADPLVVNSDMTIIGGHQRLTVAIDLGFTEVPCAVVDIDKTREKALNIALNKITGAWDENLLADLLKDIQDSNFDLGFTGFDPPEIETLFNKVHTKDVAEDDRPVVPREAPRYLRRQYRRRNLHPAHGWAAGKSCPDRSSVQCGCGRDRREDYERQHGRRRFLQLPTLRVPLHACQSGR